jgi:hypothetical protein
MILILFQMELVQLIKDVPPMRSVNQGRPPNALIKDANEVLDQTAKFDISLDELISRVCAKREIKVKDLISKSRKRYLSQARAEVCYLAVDELGYRGDDVARSLRISGRGVSDCRQRGMKILDNTEIIGEYLA